MKTAALRNFMRSSLLSVALAAACLTALISLPLPAGAQEYVPLYTFSFATGKNFDDDDGAITVIQGTDGNLYGTTFSGGTAGHGTAFRLLPSGQFTILHNFGDGSVANDGKGPSCNMILANDGNFYGETQYGGSAGYGTIFRMTPSGTITIVHSFGDGSVPGEVVATNPYDGLNALLQGTDGNFYGANTSGGTAGDGSIFKMTPSGTVTLLHSFTGAPNDGLAPDNEAGLIEGTDGNFYATTNEGGSLDNGPFNRGTVFKVTPDGTETILYSFNTSGLPGDGWYPDNSLVQGADGNFYGTTNLGGAFITLPGTSITEYGGTVYRVSPGGTETVLHRFLDGSVPNDGWQPETGLVQGIDGNFYGTTLYGGSTIYVDQYHLGYGTLFVITPSGNLTILHSFGDGSVPNDGQNPGYLYPGLDGNIYGTTNAGAGGGGNVFEIVLSKTAPPAPELSASPGFKQINLAYGVPGAITYNIYRATSPGAETLYKTAVTGPSYADTNVTFGTTYYYEVTGVNPFGESGKSNEASATPLPPPPPPALIAFAGNAQVSLSWTASAGATSYTLYRSTSSGTETLYQAGLTSTNGTDLGVTNGTTYYYEVTAVGPGGESGKSNEVSAMPNQAPPPPPPAPTKLVATAGNAQVSLTWTGSAGATSYNVYRSTSSGTETLYHVSVAATNYLDTGLTNGTTYYYEVTAINASGESGKSNEGSATPVPPPPAPLNLIAAAGNAQVSLSWTASAGATSYNVQRSTKSGWETLYQAGVTGTTYTDTGVTNGVTYYYKVSAGNAGGFSALSNEASATPKAPAPPSAPTGLTALAGNAQVALSWTAGTGATSYSVYRSKSTGTETLQVSGVTGTAYTDTGLTNGTTYFYKVKSVNAAGASGYSNEASTKPHPPAPPAPTLTATGGVKQISLSWTASAGATSYRVYRAKTSGGEVLLVGGITSLAHVDKSVTPGVTYYYKVSALNATGASPLSNEASAVASN